jgi:hypothetical protein
MNTTKNATATLLSTLILLLSFGAASANDGHKPQQHTNTTKVQSAQTKQQAVQPLPDASIHLVPPSVTSENPIFSNIPDVAHLGVNHDQM